MSRGIAAASSHRRYGAMDSVPDVDFADPDAKVELKNMCEKVANNIQTINNYTRKLEIDVRNIGSARDNQNLRDSLQATQLKCNDLVAQTVTYLSMITDKSRSADKATKLQVERLQTEMQLAVPTCGSIQKEIASKVRRYVLQQPVSPTEDPDQMTFREQEAAYNQQQRQVQMELEFEGGMLEDRLSLIKDAEVKVLDVNTTMRMLASIVNQQAPMLDTIEQNTENTLANVETANQELIKAATHVGRRRRTVFCLASVAIIVAIIVLVIVLTRK